MTAASPVKILYVIDKLVRAGAQRHLLRVVRGLDRDHFIPAACCLLYPGPIGAELKREGVEVFSLDLENIMGMRFFRGTFRLARLVRRHRIDLIHAYLFSANLVAPAAGFLSRRPVVTSRRDTGFWKTKRHILALRAADYFTAAVTVNSGPVDRYLRREEKVFPPRAVLIENGIDISSPAAAASPFSDKDGPVRLVSLGNIRPVKGYEYLIRSLSKLENGREIELEIGGRIIDTEYYHTLLKIIGELGLEEKVKFAGEISDVAGFLKGHDIFILPSVSEGFSNALLEALGTGLPAIATSVGANPEVITDKLTGLIVAPEDEAALAEAIDYLVADGSRSVCLAAAGRKVVAERYSNQRMCRSLEKLYRDLLEK